MRALLLVDIQNDFCPGGSLAIHHGDDVVPIANELAKAFGIVVLTRDYHPANHSSFIEQGGPWPAHCVQGTKGSEFHPELKVKGNVVRKGKNVDADSYSGFADDNGRETGLSEWLVEHNVDELFIMGLATDYCVKFTVFDALKHGFTTHLVLDGCRGVNINPGDEIAAVKVMEAAGAIVTNSKEVIRG